MLDDRALESLANPAGSLPVAGGPASPVEYQVATEADRELIARVLGELFPGPERDGIISPSTAHELQDGPEWRLVARSRGRIVSHVHLLSRRLRRGGASGLDLPVLEVQALGTLPAQRGRGHAQRLMGLAEVQAVRSGAALLTLCTATPEWFLPMGWVAVGRGERLVVPSRALPAGGDGLVEAKGGPWLVRPWRQIELPALLSLYDAQFAATPGAALRSEVAWRGIIARRPSHTIWVAAHAGQVCGYAFVREHHLLEIATDPAHPAVLQALLGRLRAEALERDFGHATIHAPTDHPASGLAAALPGSGRGTAPTVLARVPDPEMLLRALWPNIVARADVIGVELGLIVGDRRFRFRGNAGSPSLELDRSARRKLEISPAGFVRLALGSATVEELVAEGIAHATPAAQATFQALFPAVGPVYRSPLDGGPI